jgi:hypothetical protein
MSIYNQTPSEWTKNVLNDSNRYRASSQWNRYEEVYKKYYKNLEAEVGLQVDLIPDNVLVHLKYHELRFQCSFEFRQIIRSALIDRGLFAGSAFEKDLKSKVDQVNRLRDNVRSRLRYKKAISSIISENRAELLELGQSQHDWLPVANFIFDRLREIDIRPSDLSIESCEAAKDLADEISSKTYLANAHKQPFGPFDQPFVRITADEVVQYR